VQIKRPYRSLCFIDCWNIHSNGNEINSHLHLIQRVRLNSFWPGDITYYVTMGGGEGTLYYSNQYLPAMIKTSINPCLLTFVQT